MTMKLSEEQKQAVNQLREQLKRLGFSSHKIEKAIQYLIETTEKNNKKSRI